MSILQCIQYTCSCISTVLCYWHNAQYKPTSHLKRHWWILNYNPCSMITCPSQPKYTTQLGKT